MIKLFELKLNKNAFAIGFHGCPMNRVNTFIGNTKGGFRAGQDGRHSPSTVCSCYFSATDPLRSLEDAGGSVFFTNPEQV